MPKRLPRQATDIPTTIQLGTKPLTPQEVVPIVGRPRKPRKSPLPKLEMTPNEVEWCNYLIYIYNKEYELSESDQILLR